MNKEIINTHDQMVAAGGGVAIVPAFAGTRTQYQCGWAIYRVNSNGQAVVTDPLAHWQNNHKKVFSDFAQDGSTTLERRRAALEAAKQWVAEQGWYSGEWARNRQRDYVPKDINKQFPLKEITGR